MITVRNLAKIAVAAAFACTTFKPIDGSTVAPITTPSPTCAQLCERLAYLCGFAPAQCWVEPVADADPPYSYCGTFDDDHKACVAQAPSCQAAHECSNAEPAEDAGTDAADDSAADALDETSGDATSD